MSKHPFVIVCAPAFLVGGAFALLLEYPPREAAGAQVVTAMGADVNRETVAESEAVAARTDDA